MTILYNPYPVRVKSIIINQEQFANLLANNTVHYKNNPWDINYPEDKIVFFLLNEIHLIVY